MGGLGNQMFQYACGRAVSHRMEATFYLDLSWFNTGNRQFLLDFFPNLSYTKFEKPSIKNHQFFKRFLRKIGYYNLDQIHEPEFLYWSGIEEIKQSAYLSGYWNNENYFKYIETVIREAFVFPPFSCLEATSIANSIKTASCPVSIHVRRGDYIENPETNKYHGICHPEYYNKALGLILEKNVSPTLFIFSDDITWVKNNFDTLDCSAIYIDIPQHIDAPFHDMHLMSLCRHHIIANSTFSWWGAWLSDGKDLVIAPKQWFLDDSVKHANPSPEPWVLI